MAWGVERHSPPNKWLILEFTTPTTKKRAQCLGRPLWVLEAAYSILRKLLWPTYQDPWKVASFKCGLERALPQVQDVIQASCHLAAQPGRPCGIRGFCVWKRHQVKLMARPKRNHKAMLRLLEQDHAICSRHFIWKAGLGLPQGPNKNEICEQWYQVAMWPDLSIMSLALSYSPSRKVKPTQHQFFISWERFMWAWVGSLIWK